jgi:hypothetical protein
MTCAGLLGLAMVYGSANEAILRTAEAGPGKRGARAPARNPGTDAAVIRGLNALSTALGRLPPKPEGPREAIQRRQGQASYYFLWSLERVAVAYDLKTIGRIDWYAWGSAILLAGQEEDGSWTGEFGSAVDTSFALLFLRRSNLASDLTANLKGQVKDPAEVTLKAGGVGGQAVKPDKEAGRQGEGEKQKRAANAGGRSDQTKQKDKETKPDVENVQENVARFVAELVNAPPEQRDRVIERYKEGKGVAHTEALSSAIGRLPAIDQAKARDALAERLMRMNAMTLRERLKDANAEMRVAAARACAGKDDTAYVPDLIGLLQDREPMVVRAARSALKLLSKGKDFGPAEDAPPAERARAIEQWNKWWTDSR